ncbi:MAG TPA: amino acid adenylation domain-containing protein [Micromonosporaceae bacterium]|nr:amino acid adenylation domain-containing protein [Micromonosporaceae bacterium]
MTTEVQVRLAGAADHGAGEVLPMTESQKGLLVVNERVAAGEIYNQIGQFDIDVTVTAEMVRAALATLVAVQPSLRQVFRLRPEVHAVLLPPPAAEQLAIEYAEAGAADYDQVLADLVRRVGGPPFDLATGPVCRFGHVRSPEAGRAAVIVCMHHIVGDGFSVQPIVRDLDAALAGTLAGEAVGKLCGERERAFRRELAAQNRMSAAEATLSRAAAWAQRLREVPPLVLNPRPHRPVETAFTGFRLEWALGPGRSAAVNACCRRLSITPFVFFTAVYATVVARHGGVRTVLVGSPLMARRTVGAFQLCGFFVNTLPVQVEVDWDRTFDDYAGGDVRGAVDYCRANVDVAFNQLVAEVGPDRSTNRNPLFSCMLAMQDTFETGAAGSMIGAVREPGNGTAKFDLWLGVSLVDGAWILELEYDRELISPAVADGLLSSLRSALCRAVADGSTRLRDLFTDASAAASRRTDGWPADVAHPSLIEWVRAVSRQRGDAPALEGPGGTMSYADLEVAWTRAAAGLVARGVRAGDVVGLSLPALDQTVTAMLAILALGATYLPLDDSLPPDRLAYMIEKAGCRLVVGTLDGAGALSVPMAQLTATPAPAPAPAEAQVPQERVAPAYVMFTSGSTGRPKGVYMGQAPLLNLTAWQIAALGMDTGTRFMQYAPLGFDVSFQEIIPTLAAGGTIVSREPADRRDFPALIRRLVATGTTHLYLPVAALRPLVQRLLAQPVALPALRYLCVSGEQLVVDEEIRRLFRANPWCVLVNLYGPTETHAVTTYRLRGDDPAWPRHVPIGLPLTGVAGYVVDVTGHLAPPGVPGELFLGGLCPADGYINDPERTAVAFLTDRFAGRPGGTMYRTGDRVLRDDRGELVFLGRDDEQVKIRGYRVELGELEVAARDCPGVRQAVAALRGEGAERELVLFVVPGAGHPVDPEEVRAWLARALPAYMVPAWVFLVDALPTGATGKTDRVALLRTAEQLVSERNAAAAEEAGSYADDLERELAELWSGLLGVEGIVRDRPVLDYGAHSLTVLTALGQVEARYGVAPPIVDFFRSPTIATLASLVRAGQEDAR